MKTAVNRREEPRWPVQLLARCVLAGKGEPRAIDVKVRDVNEKGVKLETGTGVPPAFRPGSSVVVEDFFYDEKGPRALQGAIRWSRRDPKSGAWTLGVVFREKDRKKSASFQEFVNMVKTL